MKAVSFQERAEEPEGGSGSVLDVCSLSNTKRMYYKALDAEERKTYLPGATVLYGCFCDLGYSHLLPHDNILWPNHVFSLDHSVH